MLHRVISVISCLIYFRCCRCLFLIRGLITTEQRKMAKIGRCGSVSLENQRYLSQAQPEFKSNSKSYCLYMVLHSRIKVQALKSVN